MPKGSGTNYAKASARLAKDGRELKMRVAVKTLGMWSAKEKRELQKICDGVAVDVEKVMSPAKAQEVKND
jgi:pyruvate-formate lyase-activating enzyme